MIAYLRIWERQSRTRFLLFLFLLTAAVIVIGFLCSLKFGQAAVSWRTLYEALTGQGSSNAHMYVRTLRLPRAIMAFLVGGQMAIGGLLTQMLTRNPLASPHLFGLHAGATLAVVSGMAFLSAMTLHQSVWLAFAGSAFGALLVWSLAGVRRASPIRMALAGMAVHLLLSSLTEGMMILNQETLGGMMFWLVGSVQNANWTDIQTIVPWTVGAAIACIALLPSIKLLLLDDEVAAGLGQRVAIVRTLVIVLVVVLTGSAVALCGPIGFIGLIVPHVARPIVGHRLTVLLPFTGLLGGCLLVYADFASRFIAFPFESPVGILTAVLGGPFFIYLARRGGRQSL